MAAQLLLVGNPAKRRAKSRKPRSAAQKAATRRMLAANRAKRGGAVRSTRRRKTYKRRARTVVSTTMRSNPVRHRRRAKRAHTVARRRTRRNPVSSASIRNITGLLKTSAVGAAGALGVDVLMGFIKGYLPAALATPTDAAGGTNYGYHAAKGALAIGTAMAMSKVIGAQKAARIAEGSLTVQLHSLMAGLLAANVSSVPLGMYTTGRMGNAPGGLVLPMQASGRLRGVGGAGMGMYVSAANREMTMR